MLLLSIGAHGRSVQWQGYFFGDPDAAYMKTGLKVGLYIDVNGNNTVAGWQNEVFVINADGSVASGSGVLADDVFSGVSSAIYLDPAVPVATISQTQDITVPDNAEVYTVVFNATTFSNSTGYIILDDNPFYVAPADPYALAVEYRADGGDGTIAGDWVSDDPDFDDDGIDDQWEIDHFAALYNCDPSVDSDADLFTNLQEFLHGTNPTVQDTYLLSSVLPGSIQLEFNAFTNAIFQVEYTTDLVSGNWQPMGSQIVGDNTMKLIEPATTNDMMMFRVKTTP